MYVCICVQLCAYQIICMSVILIYGVIDVLMWVYNYNCQFNSIQLFFFSQTIINTQINNNKQIIENIHNL